MSRVLMVASEAAPFAKTGGLADVLGGLPPALAAGDDEVAVLLPKYRAVELHQPERVYRDLPISLGGATYQTSIDLVRRGGVAYYFLNCPPLYDRDGIYNVAGVDFPDNHLRFAVLCRAALEVVRRIFRPDIIHCHDWQAGLVPVYLRQLAGDPTFIGLKTLVTIHNLGYQGRFLPSILPEIGVDVSFFRPDLLEFYGDVNLLKGGLVLCDAINTVSRAYAREIQTPEHGFGFDGLLRSRSSVLTGILNGVDYTDWNPETDKYIAANYSAESLDGKRVCKQALIEELELRSDTIDRPLIGIVSRFATQKGFDLVGEIAGPLLDEHDVALAALGSGEPGYELMFTELAAWRPERVGLRIGYDDALAHRIEAGADMFLMPSHYEPCGLNQIYSLRYGTVPVVRATGGLDDTIDEATGFKFQEYSGQALLDAIRAALEAFDDSRKWREMIVRGMQKDYSWGPSAREYSQLYQRLRARPTIRAA